MFPWTGYWCGAWGQGPELIQNWPEMKECKQVYATDETGSSEGLRVGRLFLARAIWGLTAVPHRKSGPSFVRELVTHTAVYKRDQAV